MSEEENRRSVEEVTIKLMDGEIVRFADPNVHVSTAGTRHRRATGWFRRYTTIRKGDTRKEDREYDVWEVVLTGPPRLVTKADS